MAKQYGSFRLQQAQEAIGLEQARIGRRISQLKNATGPVSKRQRKALIRRQRAALSDQPPVGPIAGSFGT